MSKLYEQLRDIAADDATVFSYLRMQDASGKSDYDTLIALVRQLAKEKKAYFQDAVDTRSRSMVPIRMQSLEKERM